MKRNDQHGFALVMVMGITILFMVLGATTAYMVFKAQQMSSGQARYTSALIAADAAQDMAANRIRDKVAAGNTPVSDTTITMGTYSAAMSFIMMSTSLLSGNETEMAAAYEGIGTGAGSGGAANFYRVVTRAQNTGGVEVSQLEVVRRKIIGGQ